MLHTWCAVMQLDVLALSLWLQQQQDSSVKGHSTKLMTYQPVPHRTY